jgi:hypothetical protein
VVAGFVAIIASLGSALYCMRKTAGRKAKTSQHGGARWGVPLGVSYPLCGWQSARLNVSADSRPTGIPRK